MKLTVDIPDQKWARMVELAESRGLKVADLVRAGVISAFPQRPVLSEQIVRLVTTGLPDAVIAERLACAKSTVAGHRRAAGLPANPFLGAARDKWADEFDRTTRVMS